MTSSHIDSVYLKLKYELTQVEHQLLEQQFAAAKRIMHLEEIVATLSEKVNVAPEPPKTPPAVVINNKTSQTTDELEKKEPCESPTCEKKKKQPKA